MPTRSIRLFAALVALFVTIGGSNGPTLNAQTNAAAQQNLQRSDAEKERSAHQNFAAADVAPAPANDEPVTYEQVRPVLKKHCQACHNNDRERGGLDVSTLAGIKAGGASGIVAVPEKPDESLLYTLTAQIETPKMPPNKPKIPQRELDLIRRWIEGGMLESGGTTAAPAPVADIEKKAPTTSDIQRPMISASGAARNFGVAVNPLPRPTAITALAASPAGSLIAVSGRNQVVLFQSNAETPMDGPAGKQSNTPFRALPFPEGDVFSLRFSRDGEWLLAGGGVGGLSGKVVGFEVATGRRLFEVGDESDVVLALDISPDKTHVALGGPGRTVKLYRLADGALKATLRKHTDWILALAFSPEGLLLASGDRFGGLQVWEAESGKEFYTFRGHVGPVTAVDWSSDSERLLSAGQDRTVRLWDMHSGQPVANWDGGVGGILAAQCDDNGRVICGGREGKIAVWEHALTSNEQAPVATQSMSDEVVKLAVTHDRSQIIAADAAGNLASFSLQTGELVGKRQLPLSPELARAQRPRSSPTKPTPQPDIGDRASSDASQMPSDTDDVARRTAHQLQVVRELSTKTNAALKATEESLTALRESAVMLEQLVTEHERVAKNAARRASELNSKVDEMKTSDIHGGDSQKVDGIAERQALYESAAALAVRIQRAARQSPKDARLESAAKLAAELRDALNQEPEIAAGGKRR